MRPFVVLLAEDNIADQKLFQLAVKEGTLPDLYIVDNGRKALEYLKQIGIYSDAPTPDIIVLDINLPKINGIEVLDEKLKMHALKDIPVVLFTGATPGKHLKDSLDTENIFYAIKPDSIDRYFEIVQALLKYCENRQSEPAQEESHRNKLRKVLEP